MAPIGVHALERKAGTLLSLSLSVTLNRDPSQAWALENSVDYAELVALIQKMSQTEYLLLEELGQGILEAIGDRYSEVESARICIAKPHILIAGAKLESCSVELSRVFRH